MLSSGLNSVATAKVTIAVERIARSNLSNVKAVGSGVSEYTIDFGPGYRIYMGRHQQNDIEAAKEFWADYKRRKRAEQEERK